MKDKMILPPPDAFGAKIARSNDTECSQSGCYFNDNDHCTAPTNIMDDCEKKYVWDNKSGIESLEKQIKKGGK